MVFAQYGACVICRWQAAASVQCNTERVVCEWQCGMWGCDDDDDDDGGGAAYVELRRLAAVRLLIPMMRSGLQKQAEAAAAAVCDGGVCERGGERGDDGGSRMVECACECECECECECAECGCDWRLAWWGWWCVRVRQAACERGMRKRHAEARTCQAACKASGMQMRREHDGKAVEARTFKPPLRNREFRNSACFDRNFFLSRKKLTKK